MTIQFGDLPNAYGFGANTSYTSPLRLWAPDFMAAFGGPTALNQTQANTQASYLELFGVRSGGSNNYAGFLTGMRTQREGASPAKPALKMLFYDLPGGVDGVAPDPGDADHLADLYHYPTATDPGAGLRNNKAFLSQPGPTGGSYIMKCYDSRWQTFINSNYAGFGSYDGVLVDVVGPYPVDVFHNGALDPQPWNFDTQAVTGGWYSEGRWMEFTTNMMASLRTALGPGVQTFGNGIQDGPTYWDANFPSSVLLDGTHGMMVEEFYRNSSNPVTTFRSEIQWKNEVDMLIDAGLKWKPLLCCTKTWTSATQGDSKRLFAYSLALFLIGTNGMHFWHYRHDYPSATYVAGTEGATFTDAQIRDDQKGRHHWFHDNFFGSSDIWLDRINLGAPTANYTVSDAYKLFTNIPVPGRYLYARTFQRGVVLANPTVNSCDYPLNLPVGHSYQNIDGTAYTFNATVTVAAHTALVISQV